MWPLPLGAAFRVGGESAWVGAEGGWGLLLGAGCPVSCRPMVAVSAARLKVVAIERFARRGALHLDPLRCDGGSAAVRKRGTCGRGPKGPFGPRASGPKGRASPGRAVSGRIPARPPGFIGQRVPIQ
ncbi:hypothetical protein GCM10028793_38900 [Nocardiopsis oceani]